MKRSSSLPQFNATVFVKECRPEANYENQSSKHERPINAKGYGGRYSLNKAKNCGKYYNENIQDRVRMRNSSVRGQVERFPRHENYTVRLKLINYAEKYEYRKAVYYMKLYDEVYRCLLPEPNQPLADTVMQPSASISTAMMRCELGRSASDRDQYHCSLYRLLRVSVMAKLNRLCEKTALGSVRKLSQQVLFYLYLYSLNA
ncbi:unnamed protein product [Brugia timori]|uniref:Uncharacterized protein n=1 Tax=Brugia timori TaxID=42155 RepID=A0A0R3QKL7_9BILA|nr:unnamed protein product [Brugia timori]